MVITLKPGTTEKGIQHVLDKIKELGFTPHVSKGAERTIIGVIGENAIRSREIFQAMFIVESVMPISRPYKLVSREFKSEDTVVKIEDVEIGGKEIVVMAGPCAVENRAQLLKIAQEVKEAGARILRGGAFKPRTSPYSFQGLGEEGLKYLAEASEVTHLPVVTEARDVRQVELVARYAHIIQVGARNMQNFDLLKEVGRGKKPVLLKRGMSSTVKEFLMSAEYILSSGNYNVILCEIGISSMRRGIASPWTTVPLKLAPLTSISPTSSSHTFFKLRISISAPIWRRISMKPRRVGFNPTSKIFNFDPFKIAAAPIKKEAAERSPGTQILAPEKESPPSTLTLRSLTSIFAPKNLSIRSV